MIRQQQSGSLWAIRNPSVPGAGKSVARSLWQGASVFDYLACTLYVPPLPACLAFGIKEFAGILVMASSWHRAIC